MSESVRIVCEGLLEKHGRWGWKKYHCVLDGFTFCITPHGSSRLSLSSPMSIHTKEIQNVRGVSNSKATAKPFLFEIVKTDNKNFMMGAPTEQDRKRWLQKFNKVLSAYKEVAVIKTLAGHSPPPPQQPPPPPCAIPRPSSDGKETYAYVEIRARTASSYESNDPGDLTYSEITKAAEEDIAREIEYMEAKSAEEKSKSEKQETPQSAQKRSARTPPNHPPPPPPQNASRAPPQNPPPPRPQCSPPSHGRPESESLELYSIANRPDPATTSKQGKDTKPKPKPATIEVKTNKSMMSSPATKPGIAPKPSSLSVSSASPASSISTSRSPRSPTTKNPRSPTTDNARSQATDNPRSSTTKNPRSSTENQRSPTTESPRSPVHTSPGTRSPAVGVSSVGKQESVSTSPTRAMGSKSHSSPPKSEQDAKDNPKDKQQDSNNNNPDKYAAIRRHSSTGSNRRTSSGTQNSDPDFSKASVPPSPTSQKLSDDDHHHHHERAEDIAEALRKTFPPIPALPFSKLGVDTSSVDTLRKMLAGYGNSKKGMKLGKGGEGVTQMKLQLKQISELVEEEEEEDEVFLTAL